MLNDSASANTPFGISITHRAVSSGAEDELFRPYTIDTGMVELVDYMGSDSTVERVATAGHGRHIFGTAALNQGELINYLVAKGITDPFRFVQMKFNLRCPIEAALVFVYAREASVNEYSGRYSTMLESGEHLTPTKLNQQQNVDEIIKIYESTRENNAQQYKKLLSIDFARELARSGLGINNDTKFFWKIDLLSFVNLYQRAQKFLKHDEIMHSYLDELASITRRLAPLAWDALINPLENIPILQVPSDDEVVDAPLCKASTASALTKRVTVQTIEDLLFKQIPLFGEISQGHGAVQAVEYMGDDSALAQAARVSYGQGTKKRQDDIQLIHSLVRDEHTSPIEMAELAVESKLPVFSDPRQAGRHRTLDMHGFMGYTPIGSQSYKPDNSQMMYQDRKDRQGRSVLMTPEDQEIVRLTQSTSYENAINAAQQLRTLGASETIVRKNKGVGFFTRGSRTGDALNWARFFKLRSDPHAQYEVRVYSHAVEQLYKAQLPHTFDAFRTYMLDALKFSTHEQSVLSKIDIEALRTVILADNRFSKPKKDAPLEREPTREGEGFLKKLEQLKRDRINL